MIKEIRNKSISGKHNKPILIDFFYKKNDKPKAIIIFCHGYKGYKDWGSWNLMAEYFANNDFFFVKFNFSHNGGTKEQPIDFPDLNAFAKNNFSIELNDLQSVIDHCLSEPNFSKEINPKKINLIGHSRGGGIALITAFEDTRINKVISWAGISDIGSRFPKGEKLNQWKTNKVAYVLNSRTKQQMPVHYQLYEDFKNNEQRLNIKNAVSNLKIPQLIIHGTDDHVVLLKEAKYLHNWNTKSELQILDNMDHGLGNSQPWLKDELPIHMQEVVKYTLDFILKV